MILKYRRLSPTGDYVFGQNNFDFISAVDAVKQAIETRLKLLLNEWWEDQEDGLPFFEQIAGVFVTPEKQQAIDLIIRDRITGTLGVSRIIEFVSTFDSVNRKYTASCKVDTIYGEIQLEVTV
jgi:hypothetical protein